MFLASDALPFRRVLANVKDGWTFADIDGSWWVDGSVTFSVDGGFVASDAVYPLAGRVAFPRCLRGRTVVAEGSHYPTVCAATASEWTLRVVVPIADTTGLNDYERTSAPAPGRSATAELAGCRVEGWLADALAGARVLAQLPYSSGLIVGVGVASYGLADTTAVQVVFDEGDVTYVH